MAREYKFRITQADIDRYQEMSKHENELREQGFVHIAGIDEAGRGPLAGPVSVAACILDPAQEIIGLNDSKKLTEKRREYLFHEIKEKALAYQVVLIPPEKIEDLNILGATKWGMAEAVLALKPQADMLLIDAVRLEDERLPAQRSLIHGDALSNSIAAASVLAKVTRDHYMQEQALLYPAYGFEKHKGYATSEHYAAIEKYGITPIHRLSFLSKLCLGETKQKLDEMAGYQAEKTVAQYFEQQGYKILEHNFWIQHFGEIDLIAQKGNRIAFIEVKARNGASFDELGINAVDAKKQWRIKRIAEYYLASRHIDLEETVFLLANAKLDADNQVETIKLHLF